MGGMIIILIIMIIMISVSCFLVGRKMAATKNSFLRQHPVVVKIFLLGYVVFAGCFVFPFGSEPFPLDFTKLYLIVLSYGMIGLGLAGVYGAAKERLVYPRVLFLTILGMICRYILEYGEVSNTYNFTMLNIISYMAIVPTFIVIAYHYAMKYLIAKKLP